MPNILFLSNNPLFLEDLSNQIRTCLPEDYKIYSTDDNKAVFDMALLDGIVYLEDFRAKHPKVPALILEPTDSENYAENKLDLFAYKPLILSSILDQIQSSINIFTNSKDGFLRFGSYELHPRDKEIFNLSTKELIKLTEREISIIQYLYKLQGKAATKTELLQNVWAYSADVSTHTIETHIYRLRKKVEKKDAASLIIAEEGGYRLAF